MYTEDLTRHCITRIVQESIYHPRFIALDVQDLRELINSESPFTRERGEELTNRERKPGDKTKRKNRGIGKDEYGKGEEKERNEMAETILERIPSLTGSPSMDLSARDAFQSEYMSVNHDGFDDSEFPYAHGVMNGAKCCTKCGATKTPQWREGPFGPKTLCNACGVKRTRKLRAEQDGTKRRKVSSSSNTKVSKSRQTYSSESLGVWDEAYEARVFNSPSSVRRPLRRAAEEAAMKTSRYARTGEWAAAAAAVTGSTATIGSSMQIPPSFPSPVAPPHLAASSPASSDLSLDASDCPEEISWTPLAAEAAAKSGLSGLPFDCYAAVNLMTMSRQSSQEADASAIPSLAGSPSQSLTKEDMEATLAKMDSPDGGKFTYDDLTSLYKTVPRAKVAELVRLNQELDASMNEAQAANAAVAAVAAVLAAKQASALRSREQVVGAAKRLRRFMQELDAQFGVSPKSLPRIRTSPRKS